MTEQIQATWVPVDNPPDGDLWPLLLTNGENWAIGYFVNGVYVDWRGNDVTPTHWIAIPKLPKVEKSVCEKQETKKEGFFGFIRRWIND